MNHINVKHFVEIKIICFFFIGLFPQRRGFFDNPIKVSLFSNTPQTIHTTKNLSHATQRTTWIYKSVFQQINQFQISQTQSMFPTQIEAVKLLTGANTPCNITMCKVISKQCGLSSMVSKLEGPLAIVDVQTLHG